MIFTYQNLTFVFLKFVWPGASPQPIIIERSQTLTELQKMHEQQTIQHNKEPEMAPVEKPRLKLRDSFTCGSPAVEGEDSSIPGSPEPIIAERSQALREIIRIHEQVTSAEKAKSDTVEVPTSPAPKAKLKDSFVIPTESSTPDEDDDDLSPAPIEQRSESFQTIIKRHQEQITSSSPATAPSSTSTPPVKRPGILKKPKDWSSPSPQEIPSPIKDETNSGRKMSVESSIEIQLNPAVQSSSIVVHEIPAAGLDRRNSNLSSLSSSTIQYNSVQVRQITMGGSNLRAIEPI